MRQTVKTQRKFSKVIIHTTATRPNWMDDARTSAKVKEIKRWHVSDNGFSDIGYHFLIDRDGTVAKGRTLDRIGAHTLGQNTGSIAIALIGGHGGTAKDIFADNYTPEQEISLKKLLEKIQNEHGKYEVYGHNEFAAKACPCFSVKDWLKSFTAPVVNERSGANPRYRNCGRKFGRILT